MAKITTIDVSNLPEETKTRISDFLELTEPTDSELEISLANELEQLFKRKLERFEVKKAEREIRINRKKLKFNAD